MTESFMKLFSKFPHCFSNTFITVLDLQVLASTRNVLKPKKQ